MSARIIQTQLELQQLSHSMKISKTIYKLYLNCFISITSSLIDLFEKPQRYKVLVVFQIHTKEIEICGRVVKIDIIYTLQYLSYYRSSIQKYYHASLPRGMHSLMAIKIEIIIAPQVSVRLLEEPAIISSASCLPFPRSFVLRTGLLLLGLHVGELYSPSFFLIPGLLVLGVGGGRVVVVVTLYQVDAKETRSAVGMTRDILIHLNENLRGM